MSSPLVVMENSRNTCRTPGRVPTIPKEFNFATSARTPRRRGGMADGDSASKSARKLGKPHRKPLRTHPTSPNVKLKRKTPNHRRKKIESIHQGKALRVPRKVPKSARKDQSFRPGSGAIFEQGKAHMDKLGTHGRKSIYAGPERVQRKRKPSSKRRSRRAAPQTAYVSRTTARSSRRDRTGGGEEFRPANPDLFGPTTPRAPISHRATMHAATDVQHARHQQRRPGNHKSSVGFDPLPQRMTLAARPSPARHESVQSNTPSRGDVASDRFMQYALSPPQSIRDTAPSAPTPYRPISGRSVDASSPQAPQQDVSMAEEEEEDVSDAPSKKMRSPHVSFMPDCSSLSHQARQLSPSLKSLSSRSGMGAKRLGSPISRVHRMDNARVLDALTGVIINKSYRTTANRLPQARGPTYTAAAQPGSILHTPRVQRLLGRTGRGAMGNAIAPSENISHHHMTPGKDGAAFAALRRQQLYRSIQKPRASSRINGMYSRDTARTPAPRSRASRYEDTMGVVEAPVESREATTRRLIASMDEQERLEYLQSRLKAVEEEERMIAAELKRMM